MRKILSILLLAVLGLPWVTPLFAFHAEPITGLPACCLKAGKHHCMASAAEHIQLAAHTKRFAAPAHKCPYCPQALVSAHRDLSTATPAAVIFAALVSHPACAPQTESRWRIARDRSRQKRGPPSLT